MKILRVLFYFAALTLVSECSAYRILGVFPLNAKSHYVVYEAVMKGLAKRGHHVDVISHFPLKKPLKNFNNLIDLSGTLISIMNNMSMSLIDELTKGGIVPQMIGNFGDKVCGLLGTDVMQKFIKDSPKNPPYDAIIVEAFASNCYFGLGHIFKAPVIAISSGTEYSWISEFTGNDDNPAYVPDPFSDYIPQMTFWERMTNFLSRRVLVYQFHSLTAGNQMEIMRKHLSPDIPHIRELEKNVFLTLSGHNPFIYGVKPITPSLIPIAGVHIEENDELLTPELEKWMNESTSGVVYFSFGSMVLIESLPPTVLKEMFSSFEKIAPIRILMKIVDESKLPPGLPSNVKILSWMPQIPILRHPNTKAFITHGGLGGSLEALYNAVPMIGIPLFGDQFRNCRSFISKEMLIQVDLKTFSGQMFDSALSNVLYNKTYKEKAVYYSRLFRDQPMSTMAKANFWIEYVIRNGPVLRSPALDYTWWQLALIDVYAFILIVAISVLLITLFIVRTFIKFCFKSSKNNFKKTD